MKWSIAFGLERVAWPALHWPRASGAAVVVLLALAAFGMTRLVFDEDLRAIFASSTPAYANYVAATAAFADPENETLVLVEGERLGEPGSFKRLQDLQRELLLMEGVGSVYSLFSLRDPPMAGGTPRLVVRDTSLGLTPDIAARIRGHPLLGAKLLSEDGKAMVYVVTPSEAKAPLPVVRAQKAQIEEIAARTLAGSGLAATVSGFPVLRAAIVDVIRRDQIVLNAIGAAIGFVMSLAVFRSAIAAVLTAVPGISAGAVVLGLMGLTGAPVTVLSNVIPALVMVLGYADSMHLSHAWRRYRDQGLAPAEAERLAQRDVGAACMLTAITVGGAFLSLAITDVAIVREFALIGAVAMLAGGAVVLVVHALAILAIGRFWTGTAATTGNLLAAMEQPSGAVAQFVVSRSRPIALLSAAAFAGFGAMYLAVPAEHTIREHLPSNNAANAALARFDQNFGGAYPVEILIPLDGLDPTSPAALARIGAIHRAVAAVPGVATPLSLWSLMEWLGGEADGATSERLKGLLERVDDVTASRLLGADGTALVTVSTHDAPSRVTSAMIGRIEAAAAAANAGVPLTVTGVTVITAREAARTIANLNGSLATAVFGDILLIVLAFRHLPIGLVSAIANTLPLFAVGALIFLLGRGMQLETVVALTVAFGIAVDDTVHYVNRFLVLGKPGEDVGTRLVRAAREVGPVLAATTVVVVTGLSTTLTSGLPTVQLFGIIAATTLIVAVAGDLVVMPALIGGVGKKWFEPKPAVRLHRAVSKS